MKLKNKCLLVAALLCLPLLGRAGNYASFSVADYALPPDVTGAIKNFVLRGFPVRVDGPTQVALFAYDNGTFIVENFSDTAADVKISTLGNSTKLKNLVTGEILEGKLPPPHGWNWLNENREDRVSYGAHLAPHSYAVFARDTERGTASAARY